MLGIFVKIGKSVPDVQTGIVLKAVREILVETFPILTVEENDVVLVAGKGHEDYQILASETIHFDDREKVREIFG